MQETAPAGHAAGTVSVLQAPAIKSRRFVSAALLPQLLQAYL